MNLGLATFTLDRPSANSWAQIAANSPYSPGSGFVWQDLPAGQRCRFTLNAGLKTAAGANVDGKREFTFNTGGPAVMTSLPREGAWGIDEEQALLSLRLPGRREAERIAERRLAGLVRPVASPPTGAPCRRGAGRRRAESHRSPGRRIRA
jgi:hypothetical protein